MARNDCRNNIMLRQCPIRHCAATSVPRSYCPNCCAVTKTMSVTPLLGNNWRKRSSTFKPSSTSLLLISSGLTWGSSTTSLLLISPGPAKASNFFLRVQLTSLLLVSPGLWHCALHRVRYSEDSSVVGAPDSWSKGLARIAQWLKRRTRDRKVAGLSSGRSGGIVFFSGVNFLCWLLFRYPFHPVLPQ